MDPSATEELRQLSATLQRFIEGELRPLQEKLELDPEAALPPDVFKQVAARSHELGFWGIEFPEAVGGGGLNTLDEMLLREDVASYNTMFFRAILPGPEGPSKILLSGTPEQIERYLKPTVAAKMTAAFALTEPGAGSDAQQISTSARRDGDDYVLNGQKVFITNAKHADYLIVFAVTAQGQGARGGISTFIVDQGAPGLQVGRLQPSMGSGDNQYEVFFEDCRVPAAQLLGEEGKGFANAMRFLSRGRLGIAARCLGLAQRALTLATEHAKTRHAFGGPIADKQAIQWMLADSFTELSAARQLVYHTARRMDAGESCRAEIAMSKLYASEMVARVADRAVQVHGGMGFMKDCEVERIYRNVRALRIVEGTSEIQRRIIARSLLRDDN